MREKQPKVAPYICLGVDLEETTGNNRKGDCPFCGKEAHFFVNEGTGQYDCKACGKTGNAITFLGEIAKLANQAMEESDWRRISELRGIPAEAFKRYKIGRWNGEWIIPVVSDRGTVRDLRRWNEKMVMSVTGCHLQLFGLKELSASPSNSTVWVCEGEWDAIALRWLLDKAGMTHHVVVGVPGASNFKDDWVKFFKNRNVRMCYDNDNAGDDGSLRAGKKLMDEALSVRYLCWPETRPVGWDIRDYVMWGVRKKLKAISGIGMLEKLLSPRHRREPVPPDDPEAVFQNPELAPIEFGEVVSKFKEWVHVTDDFEDALAVSLAVCLANDVPGSPLWIYLVGPPGSGKTLILLALQHSERTVFRSTLTPASLVSGWNVHPDPSLLPKLDGKTAIFKDGTELLALHPDARREVYSTFRGAFDGHVIKPFGNGVTREYELTFNMIIGVTPAVHGDSTATMGERFLKYEMHDTTELCERKIRAAMLNISKEMEMNRELSEACARFLKKAVDATLLPDIPERYVDGIVALSQVTSMLRATADREAFGDRDLKYRPVYEVGTRLAKQLAKLGQMLTFVYGVRQINSDIYKILRRVAFDTSIGYHLDIVMTLYGKDEGMTREQIAQVAKIPSQSLTRRLQDMEQLDVVKKAVPLGSTVGPAVHRWKLTDTMTRLLIASIVQKPVNGVNNLQAASNQFNRLEPERGQPVAPAPEKQSNGQ